MSYCTLYLPALFVISFIVMCFSIGVFLANVKRKYKIVTDGKIFKIKFPYGTIGCVDYETIEQAKETIDRYTRDELKELEDKKKKWRIVE